jgi:hypothetical protein
LEFSSSGGKEAVEKDDLIKSNVGRDERE